MFPNNFKIQSNAWNPPYMLYIHGFKYEVFCASYCTVSQFTFISYIIIPFTNKDITTQ